MVEHYPIDGYEIDMQENGKVFVKITNRAGEVATGYLGRIDPDQDDDVVIAQMLDIAQELKVYYRRTGTFPDQYLLEPPMAKAKKIEPPSKGGL